MKEEERMYKPILVLTPWYLRDEREDRLACIRQVHTYLHSFRRTHAHTHTHTQSHAPAIARLREPEHFTVRLEELAAELGGSLEDEGIELRILVQSLELSEGHLVRTGSLALLLEVFDRFAVSPFLTFGPLDFGFWPFCKPHNTVLVLDALDYGVGAGRGEGADLAHLKESILRLDEH